MTLTRAEKAAATTAEARLRTGFRPGERVTIRAPRSPRYDARRGTVVTTSLGEVGVSFNAADSVEAWFLPTELTKEKS